jgi:diguanylate cyclase (GGDEF)-like protein
MRLAMRPELAAKCLELIYVQATNAYLSSIAAGTVLISIFAGHADPRWLWAFGLAYGAMIAVRAELGRRFTAQPQPRADGPLWLRRCGIAVTICGVLWGAFAVALASVADPYRLAAVVLTMGALVSGAVAAYAVAPAIYLGFTVPAMLPLALWLLSQPVSEARLLGALVLAWLLFMTSAALRFRRFALGALDLQFEHAQLVVSLAAERDRATALAQQLEVLSSTDPLTALANRRAFDEAFDEAWTAAARAREPLALVMCDIDHFKAYNDTYGHPQGDVALRRVADALSHAATRFGGTAARAGGEEFALLLPGADAARAHAAAESIRAAIESLGIPHVASALGVLTGSFGTAVMTPSRDNVPADLVERADRALYAAKNAGRNRIMAEA